MTTDTPNLLELVESCRGLPGRLVELSFCGDEGGDLTLTDLSQCADEASDQ
jgi:hypothetical protein